MSTKPGTISTLDDINVDGAILGEPASDPIENNTDVAVPKEPEDIVEKPQEDVVHDVYTPSYKYKVGDEEHEIDEMFRSIIKDKNTEEQVRNLLTKAKGLEIATESRDKFKSRVEEYTNKYSQLEKEYQEYTQMFNPAIELVEKGDLYGAAKALGFEGKDILAMAEKEIEYQNASPEHRAFLDNQERIRLQNIKLEKNTSTLETKRLQAEAEAVNAFLGMEMLKPEVLATVKYVDEKTGRQGFFEEKVRSYGTKLWNQTQGKASIAQIVAAATQQVIDEYKPFIDMSQTTTVPTQVNPAIVTAPKTVIPHVPSGGSPGRKKVMSLDDLPDY